MLRLNGAPLLTILTLAPLLAHLSHITGTVLAVIFGTIVCYIGTGFLLPMKLGLRPGVWSGHRAWRALGFTRPKIGGSRTTTTLEIPPRLV